MSNTVIIWVCVAILVFIFIAIYKIVKTFVINPIMRDKDATLSTPLNVFRESNKYDTIVKDASKALNRGKQMLICTLVGSTVSRVAII